MQFVTPTLQVAAFAVTEPGQQNDKPGGSRRVAQEVLKPS